PGETSKTVTVTVNDDSVVENDERFTVDLSNAKFNGATDATRVDITDSQGVGTIQNNDTATLTITAPSITEMDSDFTVTFTVSVNAAVQGGFDVALSASDISATLGTDYTLDTSTLHFTGTAGESHLATVTIKGDTVVEANEQFTITLGDVTGTTAVQDAA